MKTIRFLNASTVLFISIILLVTELKSQSLEDSLLIYYNWDSNYIDHSGWGYDPLFFSASYAEDREGNLNSALYFNGVDDYIILPDDYALKPTLPLSFSFWLNLDDLTPEHGVFFC